MEKTKPVAIKAKNVEVSIGAKKIVYRVNLEIPSRSWLSIIGPNGSGKTTLIRALAGLVESEGEILYDNENLRLLKSKERAQRLAVVPQNALIPPRMKVNNYVLLGRTPYLGRGFQPTNEDIGFTREILNDLNLLDIAHRYVSDLSGGERQKVIIARALTQDPTVLFLDEPTTALDIGHQQEVLELVDRQRKSSGITIISALHDLNLAAQYSTSVALMVDGRIIRHGTPMEVINESTLEQIYDANVQVIKHGDSISVIPQRGNS